MELSLRDRIRAGDPEAFAELFGAHARAVYSHAARITGDRSTAEDVVSLTFLEAWRLRERLRPTAVALEGEPEQGSGASEGDGLRPWLYGITTNVLRNTRRAARRHSAALARLPHRPADHDTVPDFADELVNRLADDRRLAAARNALGRLSGVEREVFALCVWSGLSYAAAGESLGVPASTVRSRLSRARQRLRRLSEQEQGQEQGLTRPGAAEPSPQSPGAPGGRRALIAQSRPGILGNHPRSGQGQAGRLDTSRSTQKEQR
ncbi:RNA polymerase sigma factor [Streptomyces tendae]|uniref:RNA polymerase sigma factor n=1 Tax=Streptomyces tendae TaxID=1932 RepID=UPI003790748C